MLGYWDYESAMLGFKVLFPTDVLPAQGEDGSSEKRSGVGHVYLMHDWGDAS